MATMTDRELLELAALSAGIEIVPEEVKNVSEPGDDRFIGYMTIGGKWKSGWFNPIADYGDALLLAVTMRMRITIIGDGMCEVSLPDTRDFKPVFEHDAGGDTGKATCRAITRLAAEIGKAMKEAK